MAEAMHYLDTFTDLLRQAICLISQMKYEDYILAVKQWQIADSMVQSLASQFDVLDNSHMGRGAKADDDADSVDSAKIREQIDLMVEDFPEETEKGSSWTIFNDTFLMFSDEELESIFRKAFIRSKTKSPPELSPSEIPLMKHDWSNQICDISKATPPEQAVIMMSFSENGDTVNSSSDVSETADMGDMVHANSYPTPVNVAPIQQSSTNDSIPQREKTTLSKEHAVLTSLLEQRTDNVTKHAVKTANKSHLFENHFFHHSNASLTRDTKDDLNNNHAVGSNVAHFAQSSDLSNFKIEIVMELDKGVANGIVTDSKYKIKIGPEHFNSLCGNELPRGKETNIPFVESYSEMESDSLCQIKTASYSRTCDSNRPNEFYTVDSNSDCTQNVKSGGKKDHHNVKDKRNISKKKKYSSKCKDRSLKHELLKDTAVDDVKFTSAIPWKQYGRNKEASKSNEKEKSKKKTKLNPVTTENPEEEMNTIQNQSSLYELKTNPSMTDKEIPSPGNLESIPPEAKKIVDQEDDDIVVLEEKTIKHDSLSIDAVTPVHIANSDANTLANNFFLISNDQSKDKQNVKYLILNNNNLFKTLNFDGASNLETKDTRQHNLLLINGEKNGNLLFLNKQPMKQPNNFLMNNNYSPCGTQYFIFNEETNIQTKAPDDLETKGEFPVENTVNFLKESVDTSQEASTLEQIKIAMDTPVDIQDDSCERSYEMPLLCQEPADKNKDLIQNKENILVLNNHIDEEFKYENDTSVQLRLDDSSMFYLKLNEKISNELKMGGGGKCSEIPQIYFINDLETPLTVPSEFCEDTNVKEKTVKDDGEHVELLNYCDKDKTQYFTNLTLANADINSNIAQVNESSTLSNADPSNGEDKFHTEQKSTKLSLKEALKSDMTIKPVSKSKLSLKQNSSFLKHLKSKLDKQRPVSKNQILNKAPSNYLNKSKPIPQKVKLDDMESVLTNDPVENATKILALCMQRESEAQPSSLTCHMCSMVFCDEQVLNKHVEEHNTLGKFTCTVCKKVFNNMKTLKTHSRIHTGEKPFRCSVCGKSFSQRGILSSHLAVHAGVKPHICKQCGHAFTQKSQLRLHEMRHGNIRHFACQLCAFKFTTKSDLQRHQRSHEGVKPFRCEFCDKSFTRQIMMKEHMNRHKGVQPYACCSCDKTFFDAQSLNKHKLTHKIVADVNGKSTPILPVDAVNFKAVNGSKLFGGVG